MPRSPCSGRGFVGVGGVPLGPADGREQHRIGAACRLERLVRQRRPGGVDRRTAQQRLLELERDAVLLADDAQDLDGLGGDLGADPVTGKQADAIRRCHG